MVKSVRILEAGYCVHPEAMVLPGASFSNGRFPSSVAVIEHAREGIILFDTGYSSDFDRVTAGFPESLYRMTVPVTISEETTARSKLGALGISVADVRHVVLSHLHADHSGGVRDFTKAELHLDMDAQTYYENLSRFNQVRNGYLAALMPDDLKSRFRPLGESAFQSGNFGLGPLTRGRDLFGDGSVVAIPLPGHMLGHIGLLVQTESGDRSFFVGDAAWRTESIEKNRLPSLLTRLLIKDWKAYARTLSDLHSLHLAHPELKIIPCHCEEHIGKTGSETGVA